MISNIKNYFVDKMNEKKNKRITEYIENNPSEMEYAELYLNSIGIDTYTLDYGISESSGSYTVFITYGNTYDDLHNLAEKYKDSIIIKGFTDNGYKFIGYGNWGYGYVVINQNGNKEEFKEKEAIKLLGINF